MNALERAVSAARHEPVLFPKHLPVYIRVHLARASVEQGQADPESPLARVDGLEGPNLPTLVEAREAAIAQLEQRYLRELMTFAADMNQACVISGLSRSRLYSLLKKHNLPSCFRLPS